MARKPPKSSASRAEDPLQAEPGPARRGPGPVLIVSLLLLAGLAALIAWLQYSTPVETHSRVSLALDPASRSPVEELIVPPQPQPAVPSVEAGLPPSAPAERRTLPTIAAEDGKISLGPVPDPLLVEQTVTGPLPRVAEDGAQSWHVYAHPRINDPRPKVAVVISGMGLRKAPTQLALEKLPDTVSLAFTPYSEGLQDWVALARAHGHEVLLELPMEPYDYPENDPGPQALLTSLSAEENTDRLEWLLSRFSGYVGVINFFGAKFSTSEAALGPVMAELKGRGLMIVDNQSASRSRMAEIARQIDLPFVAAKVQLDADLSVAGIDAKLAELERSALAEGSAVGVASPLPVILERIGIWTEQLNAKGIVLVPVSSLIPEVSR